MTRSRLVRRGAAAAGTSAVAVAALTPATADAATLNDLLTLGRRVRLLEDRFEIQTLNARYNDAFDHGRSQQWAALFTPGGQFVITGGSTATVSGRAALEALSAAHPFGTFHSAVDQQLEVSGDTAIQKLDLIMTSRSPGHEPGALTLLTTGSYVDELVRTAAGWRYARRTFNADTPLPL